MRRQVKREARKKKVGKKGRGGIRGLGREMG